MQMQAKTYAGTQNGATTSEKEGKHAKRCESERKRKWAHKTVQMQAKTNAGMQNDACNANEEAMNAMQCSDGLILRI